MEQLGVMCPRLGNNFRDLRRLCALHLAGKNRLGNFMNGAGVLDLENGPYIEYIPYIRKD